jgi:P2 family phage contractile tail tube protein
MLTRDVLKNFNLFVDGRGYAGQVESFTPPVLTRMTEDFRPGGLNTPVEIEMGMEKLEASFSIVKYDADILKNFGLTQGNTVPLVARGALESYDQSVKPVVINMRGRIKSIDFGEWKSGALTPIKVTMNLEYYKQDIDSVTVFEFDIPNMIQIVNGVDLLAATRAAIAL